MIIREQRGGTCQVAIIQVFAAQIETTFVNPPTPIELKELPDTKQIQQGKQVEKRL